MPTYYADYPFIAGISEQLRKMLFNALRINQTGRFKHLDDITLHAVDQVSTLPLQPALSMYLTMVVPVPPSSEAIKPGLPELILYYLITPLGATPQEDQLILAHAMQLMHEQATFRFLLLDSRIEPVALRVTPQLINLFNEDGSLAEGLQETDAERPAALWQIRYEVEEIWAEQRERYAAYKPDPALFWKIELPPLIINAHDGATDAPLSQIDGLTAEMRDQLAELKIQTAEQLRQLKTEDLTTSLGWSSIRALRAICAGRRAVQYAFSESSTNQGKVSVVIPSYNEGANMVDTVINILDTTAYPDLEVIAVDDGSTDGSADLLRAQSGNDPRLKIVRGEKMGVGRGRNLGVTHATGDYVVFLDAHCYVEPDWLHTLIAPFNDPKVGIVGPRMTDVVHGGNGNYTGATFVAPSLEWVWVNQQHSTPYTVPLIPGGCQAVRRTEFEQLGMFDPGMTRWGSEDYELCLHYWMRGFNLAIQPDTLIYHVFRTKSHYTVQAPQVLYNRLRLAALHFSDARFGRVLDAYAGSPDLSQIVLWLMDSDTMQQRKRYAEQRTRDDDAYCLTYRVTV